MFLWLHILVLVYRSLSTDWEIFKLPLIYVLCSWSHLIRLLLLLLLLLFLFVYLRYLGPSGFKKINITIIIIIITTVKWDSFVVPLLLFSIISHCALLPRRSCRSPNVDCYPIAPSLLCGWSDGLEWSPGCAASDASGPLCSISL